MGTSDNKRSTAQPIPARILIVDDSLIARAVVGRGLKEAGMAVHEARDGQEALGLLAANSYDVVITDLCMPGIDGFTLLASVKKSSPATEVVILSGLQDVQRAMDALKLGAHAYLAKPPAHPEEVLLTVKRALEMKRLRDLCGALQQKLDRNEQTLLQGLSPRRVSPARQPAAS